MMAGAFMQNQLNLLLLFIFLILLAACRETSAPANVARSQRPIKAVTTVGIIGDIVEDVGGKRDFRSRMTGSLKQPMTLRSMR